MSQSTSNGGIGFGGVLAIVFIVLKLTGTITWSWWWVLSPLWIPIGIFLAIIFIGAIIALVTALIIALTKK